MPMQSIGGEDLHIETVRHGNTVQAYIEDGRNITHMMMDTRQASELVRKIHEVMEREPDDA